MQTLAFVGRNLVKIPLCSKSPAKKGVRLALSTALVAFLGTSLYADLPLETQNSTLDLQNSANSVNLTLFNSQNLLASNTQDVLNSNDLFAQVKRVPQKTQQKAVQKPTHIPQHSPQNSQVSKLDGRIAEIEDRLDDIEFQSGLDKIKFGLDFSVGVSEAWYKVGATQTLAEEKYSAHNKWGMELNLNMNAPINSYTKFYGRLSMAKNFAMMDTTGVHNPLDIDAGRDFRTSGQSIYVSRAYVDLFVSPEIVATIGRQPGTEGPGSNLRNNALRQSTYPALLINTLGDAAVLSYKPNFARQLQFVVRGAYGKVYQFDQQGRVRDWTSSQDTLDSDLYYASFEIQPHLGTLGKNTLFMVSYTHLENLALEVPTNLTASGASDYKVQNLGDVDLANVHFESYQAFGLPLNYFVSASYMKGGGGRTPNVSSALTDDTLKNTLLAQLKFNEESAYAVHAGLRYDFHRLFKLGAEYFYGSRYWYTITRLSYNDPLNIRATRGHAYDVYVITQLDRNQFLRLSYTHIQNNYNNRGMPIGGAYGKNSKASGGYDSTADNIMLIYNVKY